MNTKSENSRIFITGALGGLGSAFALECAQRGFDLVLSDLPPTGNRFADYLQDNYEIAVDYIPCNLMEPAARKELYISLAGKEYPLWGLINVAGLDHEGAFLERNSDQLVQIVRLNIESTLDTTHNALKLRDTEQPFRVINVASMASFYPMPFKATYAASKRFLVDLSMALHEEIRAFGTVTVLCPAGMPTTTETMRAIFSQGFWGKVTAMNPDEVAHITIRKALRGKRMVVPGWINQWIVALSSMLPRKMKMRAVQKRWEISREHPMRKDPCQLALQQSIAVKET
jgi:short-subunit dehydrogenase